jgi:hypothetical protein
VPGAGASVPVLDPAIPQFFAPGTGDELAPVLAGCARIVYADAKIGLDETRDICVVTPITDDAIAVDWDRAEPADFSAANLQKVPPRFDVSFAPLPAAATQARNYDGWEKDFARWAAQSQAVELFRSARTRLLSTPDESERDFRIRVNAAAREGRDTALQKVRDKSAARLTTLQDRVRRAEQTVQVQSEQATGAKVSAAVSVGATILGALLGRKAVNVGTLGRATTAARGMGRVGRESQDVARATENVTAIRQQLDDMQATLEADLQSVSAEWDVSAEELERVLVKPKRGGVAVHLVALTWIPRA